MTDLEAEVQRLMGLARELGRLNHAWEDEPAITAAEEALESALREALQPQWLPIETAPKDQEVLVWFGPEVGVKSALFTELHGDDVWSWCVTDEKFDPHPVRRYRAPYPTHWMELPDQPALQQKDSHA